MLLDRIWFIVELKAENYLMFDCFYSFWESIILFSKLRLIVYYHFNKAIILYQAILIKIVITSETFYKSFTIFYYSVFL